MSDFIAEVRPLSRPSQTYVPTYSPDDFVAEIRPRNNDHSEVRHLTRHCQSSGISDQDLQTVLSDRHFSREGITRLLEGSVITLVEKLLTGRPILSIEGRLCISFANHESPIVVNLNHTFLKTYISNNGCFADPSLEGKFNVKVKNGDLPISPSPRNEESFAADFPFHEFERDSCHSMAETEHQSSFHSEYNRGGEGSLSSPPHNAHYNAASPPRDLETTESFQAQSSVFETKVEGHKRQDSDDESGYTSNEKEDSASGDNSCAQKVFSTFNDYYCSGFDGKNTIYTSDEGQNLVTSLNKRNQNSPGSSVYGSDEMDDEEEDDVEFEQRLVIDENPSQDLGTTAAEQIRSIETRRSHEWDHSMEIDVDSIADVITSNRGAPQRLPHHREGTQDSPTDETEDLDSPISSDITDTDAPAELSRDSKFTSDVVSAIPHPQSLVCKHPGGFRCKQCLHIMPDAEAVSRHVQSKHDLYCCTFCCRTFTAKNNLKRHIRIHTGHRPYKCTQCSQSFARRDDLKGHMLRHDYSKPFRCSLCKKGYTDRACVKNHMAKEHRSRLMHVCPQCGESYDQEEAFAAHKKSHPELQQFSCATCSFIGTNNLMTLKHSLLHSHKLFSCKPCNAYFADPFDYTNHVRKHKKFASFSQYICCFCDVALTTYEQYIRHEYSHAQGKTHACKTCKKQFKSKSLLQDHIVTHQEPELDKAQTEQMCSESLEINESHSMPWQSKEVQLKNFLNSSLDSRFTDDYNNHSSDSAISSPVQLTCPSTPQEGHCDEFQGQLLDLSMKKPSSPSFSSKESCRDQRNFSSCPRMTGLAEHNGPRNGVVSCESVCLGQELEGSERTFRAYQTSEANCRKERRCQPLFTVQEKNITSCTSTDLNNRSSVDGHVLLSSLNSINNDAVNYLTVKTVYPTRPKSAERTRIVPGSPNAKFASRTLQRTVSQDYCRRAPLRFSPYSREKMADLAAKFVAARGTKCFEETVIAACENRKEALILKEKTNQENKTPALNPSIWQLTSAFNDGNGLGEKSLFLNALSSKQSGIMTHQSTKDSDNISREESNPETALMYQAPIVIKSEPLLEQGCESSDSCIFQNITSENVNGNVGRVNIITQHLIANHGCEDCREEFGSFSELENHSVEMHKRYLCEHCRKSFTARPNRDRHVRYHTGERPYKCDLCEMAFFRGDDLKYHRTTRHPTAQPFICTRCLASFTWGRDLERHIRHSQCKP